MQPECPTCNDGPVAMRANGDLVACPDCFHPERELQLQFPFALGLGLHTPRPVVPQLPKAREIVDHFLGLANAASYEAQEWRTRALAAEARERELVRENAMLRAQLLLAGRPC